MPFAFDTETEKILDGNLAPRLACISWCDGTESGLVHVRDSYEFIKERFERCLQNRELVIGHNIAYDMGVLINELPALKPLVFKLYDADLVCDTQLRQQLLDLAQGKLFISEEGGGRKDSYSLSATAFRNLGKGLAKGADTYRLRYGELRDVYPIEFWPKAARDYAILDAETTYRVWAAQGPSVVNEFHQSRTGFCLHLFSAWGIRTDRDKANQFKTHLKNDKERLKGPLIKEKIMRPDGTKNTKLIKQRVALAYDIPYTKDAFGDYVFDLSNLPEELKTEGGDISTSNDILKESGDDGLIALAEYKAVEKLLTTFVPVVERGLDVPINCRYKPLVNTGRAASSSPNMQNLPRKGGARECFMARHAYGLLSVDFGTIELRALAQVMKDRLGIEGELFKVLRSGKDLHLDGAADVLGISYEEAERRYKAGDKEVEEIRQLFKVANFGFPGGMAPKRFVGYAKAQGVVITLEKSFWLKRQWERKWPEIPNEYFPYIKWLIENNNATMTQVRSERVRGNVTFCACANGFFQGLAADGAKEACWLVTKACYLNEQSALYGSRPVIFIHDEIVTEVRLDRAHWAAEEQCKLMVEGMSKWIPDVPIVVSPALSLRWYKGSKERRDKSGLLIPWEPKS
jgi:DNA polymerase-1